MRKMFLLLLAQLCVVCALAANYQDPLTKVNYEYHEYYVEKNTYVYEAYVTSSPEVSGDIIIPPSIVIDNNIYVVTSIKSSAFYGCTGLTSITFPEGITKIGSSAFLGCTGLTSITIPNSVTSIGGNAFFSCDALETINISEMNSWLSIWEYDTPLSDKTKLLINGVEPEGDIVIPEGVKHIASNLLRGCKYITSVKIPVSVTSIGRYVFEGCESLGNITVAEENEIYDSRNNCNAVIKTDDGTLVVGCKNTIIPDGVKSIGEEAFFRCTGLVSVVIPSSVTTIERSAFYGCSGLTSLAISEGVATIGESAFAGCSGLTSLVIPSSVTNIGQSAFSGWQSLTELTIPTTVEVIGKRAFQECNSITDIFIPSNITDIPEGLLASCSSLANVTIAEGVQSIGREVFYGCSSLASIIIPASLKAVSYSAFRKCENLSEVHITDLKAWCNIDYYNQTHNPLYYAHHLFLNGIEITHLEIPEGVTCISNGAFYGLDNLASVTIPGTVESIDKYAFARCENLTDVTIDDGLSVIGEGVFTNCSNLINITLPLTLLSIGNNAFSYNKKLTDISIPEGVTTIGFAAFRYCDLLTSVTIPSSVTSIDSNVFFPGCPKLVNVTSMIEEPFVIESVFGSSTLNNGTLFVPSGTLNKYMATPEWNKFKTIMEFSTTITPIDTETEISISELDGQSLTNSVVDDVYYNVGSEGYDSSDGSIVIDETTDMSQITDATPGSDDIVNNFTGLILKVAAGKGTIKVNVKTTGNAQLVVQVGKQNPMIVTKTEQGDVVVSYDVAEDTYVYIYAIISSSAAPAKLAAGTDAVRIYGITVSPGATGMEAALRPQPIADVYYTFDGRLLQGTPTQKGLYIRNGRKVVIR